MLSAASIDAVHWGILQMPGASPEIDQELDPFDHPQSTMLGKANLTIFMSPRHEQIQYKSSVLGGYFQGEGILSSAFQLMFRPSFSFAEM